MGALEIALLGAIGVVAFLLAWPRRWRGPLRNGVLGWRIRRLIRRKARSRSPLVQAVLAAAIFVLVAGSGVLAGWAFRESGSVGALVLVLLLLVALVLASW